MTALETYPSKWIHRPFSENYSPDDNRFDLRPFLSTPSFDVQVRQWQKLDRLCFDFLIFLLLLSVCFSSRPSTSSFARPRLPPPASSEVRLDRSA
jgi:hypothetical protein